MANISKAERERRVAAAQTEANMADEIKSDAAEQVAEEIKYVKMTRNPEFYDEPHEANVHPHEVSSFARGGWEIA